MLIEIDFNSSEAIYSQLCNQIILGIATAQYHDGDQLPSVRALAETIGINIPFCSRKALSKLIADVVW